ncbi:hypothetical protein EVAR_38500_1 [Eumeta japonica]|uniref:Uncharacterized protein n=1 Tax=Eumeta variegata TaxID=151549 RepID=A0A4C1WAW7_EUMVA|nr:hypothetical protein EVAR_38500_1 [Eumeta japonica]
MEGKDAEWGIGTITYEMPTFCDFQTSRWQNDFSKYKDAYEVIKTGDSLRKAATAWNSPMFPLQPNIS